jgi:large subunit ribosomal protein L15
MGFRSRSGLTHAEVRLNELNRVEGDVADLAALINAGVVNRSTRTAKIIASGEVARALTVRGVGATKGARAAIEAAGGKVE